MKFKLLVSSFLFSSVFLSVAEATPFNGYIVKLKKGSQFLAQNSFVNYGQVTKVAHTNFGIFARLETNKSLSDQKFAALASNPEIEYIEPNYIISLNKTKNAEAISAPNDSNFIKQWGLKNDGKNGTIFSSGVSGEDINVLPAWGITTGNKNIKIAVIDTGVDYTHPDLKDQMDVNSTELTGKPGVDDDGNGYIDDIYGFDFAYKDGDPQDGDGHGTHCAGVIGAAHNGIGVAGVMADVKIVAIKFLNDGGSGEIIDAVSAIDYAIKRGVHVMSNSWGGGKYLQSLSDAIASANDAGITFVAAAGNEANDNDRMPSYPATYQLSNVISVGSYTSKGTKSNFSNYGQTKVHVTAPGSKVVSTFKNGDYKVLSGTSMATPHISGIIGLLISKEPNLTPAQIKERLISTSVKTSALNGESVSNGRVDAHRVLSNR